MEKGYGASSFFLRSDHLAQSLNQTWCRIFSDATSCSSSVIEYLGLNNDASLKQNYFQSDFLY